MRVDKIILGAPGCGKTTRLMREIERLIGEGVKPERILCLAFTRKAAAEARERAQERFDLSDKRLMWFRTIHSLAFRQTGVGTKQMLRFRDFVEVAGRIGFAYRGVSVDEEEDVFGAAPADAISFLENFARVTCTDLADAYQRQTAERQQVIGDDGFTYDDVLAWQRELARYKRETGRMDYTDVLQKFVDSGYTPQADVLIVDEAQDLSRLQWRAIEKLSKGVSLSIVAGDDDQAIFRWAGADVSQFLDLEGAPEVLDQSFRIPASVHRLAMDVVSRIGKRRPKVFKSRTEEGAVEFVNTNDEVDASKGNWLMLARHKHQLKDLKEHCRENGWLFSCNEESSNNTDSAKAVLAWENLRRGAVVRSGDAALAITLTGGAYTWQTGTVTRGDLPRVNFDRPWKDALVGMNDMEALYFQQARRAGERMATLDSTGTFVPAEPRIKISTIHGAKGGEADNVYLLTDMTESTLQSLDRDPDDECRVFYVGATRARQRLVIRESARGFQFHD